MHDAARRFVSAVAPLANGSVCEIGSRNVNGTVRYLFTGKYVGVDALAGPGVDIVADGATWDGDGRVYDCVVCTEVLEHATDPAVLTWNLVRLCRPGGIVIITAAAPERKPHSAIDGEELRPGEQYRGITAADLRTWLDDCRAVMIDDRVPGDIYCMAIR